jgi:uncharacterized protein (DUF302 family)
VEYAVPKRVRCRNRARSWAAWLLALLVAVPLVGTAREDIIERRTDKPFDQVIADVEFAASERNFVLIARNRIGLALRQTGLMPDAAPATVVQMCNLDVVRQLLDADPGFIRYMPCRVAVYVDGDEVVATTLALPTDSGDAAADAAAARLNRLMTEIIDYGVGR